MGGEEVSGADYPWMVSLRVMVPDLEKHARFCGASLIKFKPSEPIVLLSAAHCMDNETVRASPNGGLQALVKVNEEKPTWLDVEIFADVGMTTLGDAPTGERLDRLEITRYVHRSADAS